MDFLTISLFQRQSSIYSQYPQKYKYQAKPQKLVELQKKTNPLIFYEEISKLQKQVISESPKNAEAFKQPNLG